MNFHTNSNLVLIGTKQKESVKSMPRLYYNTLNNRNLQKPCSNQGLGKFFIIFNRKYINSIDKPFQNGAISNACVGAFPVNCPNPNSKK